ncbi:10528_t:CDS:2, partial [Acaulospora morrowiae]
LLSTPLHRASANNHLNVVNLLLSYGADPRLQDSDGQTSLHKACENGSKEVISILKGKNVETIRDNKNRVALDCCKDEETKQILLA